MYAEYMSYEQRLETIEQCVYKFKYISQNVLQLSKFYSETKSDQSEELIEIIRYKTQDRINFYLKLLVMPFANCQNTTTMQMQELYKSDYLFTEFISDENYVDNFNLVVIRDALNRIEQDYDNVIRMWWFYTGEHILKHLKYAAHQNKMHMKKAIFVRDIQLNKFVCLEDGGYRTIYLDRMDDITVPENITYCTALEDASQFLFYDQHQTIYNNNAVQAVLDFVLNMLDSTDADRYKVFVGPAITYE